MDCLYCAQEILELEESQTGWHNKCIQSFFGTHIIPSININYDELTKKAVSQGETVTGVQKKLSLQLDLSDRDKPRLTIIDSPSGFILKPQTDLFQHLPEVEYLGMQIARVCGINVVQSSLIWLNNQSELGYITKRIDRVSTQKGIQKLAMEDFCQLSDRLTEDKYKGSYEKCAALIKRYSSRLGLDLSEFALRLIVCFVMGNSDMHLKNFSLIESAPGSRIFSLSPAYDLLPVQLVLPEVEDDTALTLNGKRRQLRRNDFLKFSRTIGLREKVMENLIELVISERDEMAELTRRSFLDAERKKLLLL